MNTAKLGIEQRHSHLFIDLETFSSVPLSKAGVYKYCASPDFEILLLAYAFYGDEVIVVDLANGEEIPEYIVNTIFDPTIRKHAHNANFERQALSTYFKRPMPPEQWRCTMIRVAMLGRPLALGAAAEVMELEVKKAVTGRQLIKYFCVPCKASKANGMRTRNLPEHHPERWREFKEYCRTDVVVEMQIEEKLKWFTIPPDEIDLWNLDQKINDFGIMADRTLIENAIRMDEDYRGKLVAEAIHLTGLKNPNSLKTLAVWLYNQLGILYTILNKETLPEIINETDNAIVKRVLAIRLEIGKTSIKKYIAMSKSIGADDRIRGLIQHYGANRTGRAAGRLLQIQNLPRISLPDISLARSVVRSDDLELLIMLYGNVPDTLSQLIRTAFIAPRGSRLIIADLASIESRVLAYLANETWKLEVFRTHGKVYEAVASLMYRIPIEEIKKDSPYRQRGKVAELLSGFQGGVNALIKGGALKLGLKEDELQGIIDGWRQANPNTVKFWRTCQNAAVKAIQCKVPVVIQHGIMFNVERGILFITLPSKRRLAYDKPKLIEGKFAGSTAISYEGMNQTTKQWGVQQTFGGKLCENLTQAIARDCLMTALLRLDKAGYNVVSHIHDEVICQMPSGQGSLEEVIRLMTEPMPWAPDLPLGAAGEETQYYKK